jgi:hypothetical protein
MTVEEFLESEDTYNKVVEILSEKAGIPIYDAPSTISDKEDVNINGFIAGGCVANVLNSIRHGGEPIVRDIDIFYLFENSKGEWVNPEMDDFSMPMETGITTGGDWYGNRWIQSNGDFSIMKSHTREGIFNYIKIYVGSHNEGCNKKQIVLNGFDINGCQAGIDLVNKKLLYTKDFVEFLKSRELLVTIPINPIQTAMRLVKKTKDLNCYCNIENELKLLQYGLFTTGVSDTFGEETYDKYVNGDYKKLVDSLFTIKEHKRISSTGGLWEELLKNKETRIEPKGKLWKYKPNLEGYELPFKFTHPVELTNYWRITTGNLSENKKRKYNRILEKMYSNGVEDESMDTYRRHGARLMKGGTKKYVYNTNLSVYRTTFGSKDTYYQDICNGVTLHEIVHPVWHTMLSNKSYYDCDFDVKHIDFINDFSDEHRNISRLVDSFVDLTLQKHYNFFKTIKSLAKKRGEWVIGEMENMSFKQCATLGSSEDKIGWLNDMLDNVEKELSTPLIESIDLSGFEYKDCVKELTTTLELRSEGTKMGHCVGGYSSSISKGTSRIFHIDCDGIGSTLQISYNTHYYGYGFSSFNIPEEWSKFANHGSISQYKQIVKEIRDCKFRVAQHQGRYPEKGNIQPTETNKNIASELTQYLNEHYLRPLLEEKLWKKHLIEVKIEDEVKTNRQKKVKVHEPFI